MLSEVKLCSKCGEEKQISAEYFHRDKKSRDGFSHRCKTCAKEYFKKYYEDNSEVIKETSKKNRALNPAKYAEAESRWYRENKNIRKEYWAEYYPKNSDVIRSRSKKFYEDNKDEVLLKNKEYRKSNAVRIKISRKKYVEENKEKLDAYWKTDQARKIRRNLSQKRRSLIRNLPYDLTIQQWETCLKYFDNSCAYCGTPQENLETSLHQEHFIPISKNGSYSVDNIIPACKYCNSCKKDKSFSEWYSTFEHYNEEREKKILVYLLEQRGGQDEQ